MRTHVTQRKRTFSMVAWILVTALILQGCVVFLSSVATMVVMRSKDHLVTTVLVKKSPEKVYAAMNKVLDSYPDVKVLNKDDEKFLIEASRGKNKVSAKATAYGSGLTQLVVTADAGEEGQSDEDLALRVVTMVCDELGVQYKIIDG